MYNIYQIVNGDTLDSIASRVNLSVEELKRINGINGDISLRPGNYLIVPRLMGDYITYTVKQGDNIYAIAREYGVDYESLLQLNGLNKNDYIYPDQEIIIPANKNSIYVTKVNDTIQSISTNLNKPTSDIISMNETIYVLPDQIIKY